MANCPDLEILGPAMWRFNCVDSENFLGVTEPQGEQARA